MDISFNRYLFLKYFNNIVEIYVHNNGLHWFFKGKFHKPVKSNQVSHFLSLEKKPTSFFRPFIHLSPFSCNDREFDHMNNQWSSLKLWNPLVLFLGISSNWKPMFISRNIWRHYLQKTAVHFSFNHRVIWSCWISNWKAAHVFCRSILIAKVYFGW